MLVPFANTKFDNVSSRDFYSRNKELKDCNFNGGLSITFPDHESVIFYVEGMPATALQEYNRWVSLGDDLIEPVENKAINVDAKMTAFEMPPGFLHIFLHKHVDSTVNGELGSYLSVRNMVRNFEDEHSTCFIKVRDKEARGYVFINFGKQVGATFESESGKSYDENAMKEMDKLKGKARVSIYFLELSHAYMKSPPAQPVIEAPVEPVKEVKPEPMPVRSLQMNPVEGVKSITYILDKPSSMPAPASMPASMPAPAPEIIGTPQLKLIVVMSDDRFVSLRHRSKLRALETMNEENIAWVDRKTLASLNVKGDHKASLILSGGKEYPVTLREMEIVPEESKYVILPLKLRKRLDINKGAMIGIKA